MVHYGKQQGKDVSVGWIGFTSAHGGWVFVQKAQPGSARKDKLGPSSSRFTFCWKVHEVLVQCGLGCSHGHVLPRPKMNQNLVYHLTGERSLILCGSLRVPDRRYLGLPPRMVCTLHDSVGHWSLAIFGIYRPNI